MNEQGQEHQERLEELMAKHLVTDQGTYVDYFDHKDRGNVVDQGNRGNVVDHRAKPALTRTLTELEKAKQVAEQALGLHTEHLRQRREQGLAITVQDLYEAIEEATVLVEEYKSYFRVRAAEVLGFLEADAMTQGYNKKQLFDNWLSALAASERMFMAVEKVLSSIRRTPEPNVICPHDGKEVPQSEYEGHLKWHRDLLLDEGGA